MHERIIPTATPFVSGAVMVVALLSFVSSVCGAPAGSVVSSSRNIPVSKSVDIVVVGGNEAGCALARQAAREGLSAHIVCGQYYFSDDVSAKARYFKESGENPKYDFARAIAGLIRNPRDYKVKLVDMVRESGVSFHFNSKPVAVLVDNAGHPAGVVVANKSGIQAVVAKMIVDATPTGAVARMAGARSTNWNVSSVRVSRMYNVNESSRGDEKSLDAPMSRGTWAERCKAEMLLRDTHGEGSQLNRANAFVMHMIEPTHCIGIASENASSWPGVDKLNLDAFKPLDVSFVYVVSQSADVARGIAGNLTRPVFLADLGERISSRVIDEARSRSKPAGVRVQAVPASNPEPGLDVFELLSGHRPYRPGDYGTVFQPNTAVPVWGRYDVVVVGGGTSGMPAAYAAAKAGAKVLVVEMHGFVGGNRRMGTGGYWEGYTSGFNQQEGRSIGLYKQCRDLGVDIWYNTFGCGALREGNTVRGVTVATHMGRGAVLCRVVIDASGDGDICAAAGAPYHYLNEGDICLQEASFRDIDLYANVLPCDLVDVYSATMHHVMAWKGGKDVWDFFPMVGMRESRLIKGEHVIDVMDQVTGRTYRDLISVSRSWYDPHGFFNSDYTYAGFMPTPKRQGDRIITFIPLRSIMPQGLDNMMMVGRCHSVTHDVQGSVRMNADVINEGYAAGYCAATAVKQQTSVRRLDIKPVQEHLVAIGNMTGEHLSKNDNDIDTPTESQLRSAAEDPSDKHRFAALMRGGAASIPFLTSSFAASPDRAKAKALCALKDNTAVPYLSDWLDTQSLGQGQAYRWDNFLTVSDVDGVMWLLGLPGDKRATPALVKKLNQCEIKQDYFSHIRAVTTALGRIGDPAAAGALHDFLKRDGVMGHADAHGEPGNLRSGNFDDAYVEAHAAVALYRCGDHNGLGRQILLQYLDDWRGIFSRYAGLALAEGGDVPGMGTGKTAKRHTARKIRTEVSIVGSSQGIRVVFNAAPDNQIHRILLFDLTGRCIKEMQPLHRTQGTVWWENTDYAGGVVLIRLIGTKSVLTGKTTLW